MTAAMRSKANQQVFTTCFICIHEWQNQTHTQESTKRNGLIGSCWLIPVFVRPSGVFSRVARVPERTTTSSRRPCSAGGAAVCAGSAVPCTACRPISCLDPWAPACLSTGQVPQWWAVIGTHVQGCVCVTMKNVNGG